MIGDIRKFKFWCQKVLPLVYDDSLSYYEVLCKVVQYLNKVIEDVNSIPEYIDAAIDEKLSDEHIRELLREFIENIQSAISSNNEGENTNSSKDYSIGEMLWWKGLLYRVVRVIDAGDTLIAGTNIELVNFEDLFNEFLEEIKGDVTSNDDGGNTTASQSWTVGTWLWLNDVLYIVTQPITQGNAYVFNGDNANVEQITIESEIKKEATTRANADSSLQTAISDETTARVNAVDSLQTAITDEATTRANAVDSLQTAITDNVNSLQTAISDETTARVNADNALQEQINSIDLSKYQQYVSNPYFENIGVIHTDRTTDEIIGQDICKIGNTLLFANRGTVVGLNADAHLYSIDLQTGSYNSVVLPIGHGNGITYNPDENMLYIAPLDNTTVNNKYVIHRVNYPALTMASDVYTDYYYAAIAYDPITKNFLGMRRGVKEIFDLLDADMNIIKTVRLATTGVQQTLDYYDGMAYILESAPNKITIANIDEEKIVWTYMAVDNFDQYPLSEFNGISYDHETGEIYIGNNLNYQNAFLVSSYEFFKINLYNNNVTKKTLTNHGINLLDSIYVTSRKSLNTIFQYGTQDAPVDLLEYALAMATTTKGVGITFMSDYTDANPLNIIGHTEILAITNTGHSVTLGGLDVISNNHVTLRGINIVGDSRVLASCSLLCNDSQLILQGCTITKVNATREITANRSIIIAPTSPFSTYTIQKTISLVELA